MVRAAAEYEIQLNQKCSFSVFGHLLLFFKENGSPSTFLKQYH